MIQKKNNPRVRTCMLLLGCPWGQCPIKKQILSMSKETNINGGWNSQKALHVPFPPSMKPIFVGRRRVIPSHVANKFGSWFGTNKKLLRGVNGPISTTNDYLNTAYNDVVCLCGSCRNNALSRTHRKRFDLLQFSPNMWRVFPLFIDFPIKYKHIHLDSEKGFKCNIRQK